VPVVRLDFFLDLVPPIYDFFYLKVDTENSDHLVIYGAGDYVARFAMVTIECRPTGSPHVGVEDACDQKTMTTFMAEKGFFFAKCDFEDCHFAKTEQNMALVLKVFAYAHRPLSGSDCHWERERIKRKSGEKGLYQPASYTKDEIYGE
jgi:hypothetical protein